MLVAAGVTGLLFGIHPVHVESVAWVRNGRTCCALFFLMSVMMYVSYARDRQQRSDNRQQTVATTRGSKEYLYQQAVSSCTRFFALALMSKPMAVTLPVVLLILDWYPLNRIPSIKTLWAAGVEKSPFFILGLGSSILTILAQHAGGALSSMERIPLSIRHPGCGKIHCRLSR